MIRRQRIWVPVLALVLGTALAAADAAQNPERGRRGTWMNASRGSFLNLLNREQVQKELKLNEENVAKINEIRDTIRAEMKEEFSALRKIEDAKERGAKQAELADTLDQKVHQQLREILSKEQMMRLYQIRLQIRPLAVSLSHEMMDRFLQLSEEQKQKLADIAKEMESQQAELRGTMRGLSQEQQREVTQKIRKIGRDADEKALQLLSAEQQERLEKMKGEKFVVPMRRGQRQNN